ncbi:MAG: four helix bundle protein [Granulosicoccus sp.]|jgi:four helix bundle protein
MKDFKKLIVWQKAMEVVKDVLEIADGMNQNDKFIFSSQMGKCAISIPSNIAEGAGRNGSKDFARFLDIAIGSSFELETQLTLCVGRPNVKSSKIESTIIKLHEVQKMQFGLLKKVRIG